MDNQDRTARRLVGSIVLVTCVIAAFWPTLHAGFIWDDELYVANNVTLRSLDGLRRIWLERGAVIQYYPLVHSSFWLEYHVWGLAPAGYHAVNVLLHLVNALLVWRLLDRLGVPGAFLAGLIFAVHPMQVESVAWVTERKNVLSGFFYLLSLGAYLRVMRLDGKGPSHQAGLRLEIVALILFACALLSKTVTMTLPGVIALLIVWKRGRIERHELVRLSGPLALGLILSLNTALMEKSYVGAVGKEWDLSFAERLLVAGRALWFYLGKLVWPADVLFIYPRWTVDPFQWWQWCFPVAAVLVGALLLACRRSIGSGPIVAALYYAGTLVPALGFFSVYPMRYSFVANHFAYLATIGPIALAASTGARLAARVPRAACESLRVGALALILILVILSNSEARNFRDLPTLWESTIARNPDCFMCRNNLGNILENAGRRPEAIAQFEAALRVKPDSVEAHTNLGNELASAGRTSEAIAQYQTALRLKPDYADAHYDLGIVLANTGRTSEAIAQYEAALRVKPDSVEARTNLGIVLASAGRTSEAIAQYQTALRLKPDYAEAHYDLGIVLANTGRTSEAIAQYQTALRLKPDYADAHNNLGDALLHAGRAPEAIAQLEEALRLKPNLAEAHYNLGNALASAGHTSEAIAHLEEAVRLKPDYVEARNNLGSTLASMGRTPEAIAQYQTALRLNPDYAEAHYDLGIVLANTGRTSEAIAQLEEALRLKPDLAGGRIQQAIAQLKDALLLQQQRRGSGPPGEAGGAP